MSLTRIFAMLVLLGLVIAALLAYFDNPEPLEVKPLPQLGSFDPSMAPAKMVEDCRREGKQLFAWWANHEWQFGCVNADLRRRIVVR